VVISMLDRKLLRDLRQWRGQIVAIAAVAACGIMSFVTMQSNYDAMYSARAAYYSEYRFADLFASITRAPNNVEKQIAAIPFVNGVQTRVVQDVIGDVPGRQDPVTLRLISIPDGAQPKLNRIVVRAGRLPSTGARDEAVISEAFAQANRLDLGSTVSVVLNGRYQKLRIVGIGLSPEYVYEMRGGSDIWPDSRHFGLAWMNDSALATAFDMHDGFNDVALQLAPGANPAATVERLDAMLGRFGSLGAYGREDQLSDRFVSNELRQLRAQAIAIPLIFLSVAAFLINTALSRLVATQREQIAILKAFGYESWAVAWHYVKSAIVTVALGAVVGVAGGWWLGFRLADLYTKFFRFPETVFSVKPSTVALAVAISLAAGVLGALASVRSAVRLPPAEAMRPPSPAVFRATVLERIGLTRLFSASFRMLVRTIERKPLSSLFTAVAIAFSVAVLVVGRSTVDAVNWMMAIQFQHVSREDATITFVRPLSARARFSVRSMPGVVESEPFRVIFARVSNENRSRRLGVLGLAPTPQLHRVVDRELHQVNPPERGVSITRALADLLAVKPGSSITIAFLEGRRKTVRLPVQQVVDELIGLNVYMRASQLSRALDEDASISGAYVRLDPKAEAAFDAAVKRMPMVSGVSYRKAALDEFNRSFAESIGISAAFILGFAFVIACGVVYNSGRVALSERARELCTLRILGYGFRDTALMLVGEQGLLTLAAIPVGFFLGHLLNLALQPLYELEYYRVPIVTSNTTYAFAAGFTLLAAGVSAVLLASRLRHLDIVAALKAGE
jgi:putative ABC transport system permease protein